MSNDEGRMTNKPKFQNGQKVYHALGGSESNGMITGIVTRPDHTSYLVLWPDHSEEECLEVELCSEPVKDYAD